MRTFAVRNEIAVPHPLLTVIVHRALRNCQSRQSQNTAFVGAAFLCPFGVGLLLLILSEIIIHCHINLYNKNAQSKWLKEDSDFAEKVEDIKELQKDFAEALILKKMKEGDTTMIIFYAKTQMKDRGYSERLEHTGANGEPLLKAAEIDLSKLTDEQRKVLLTIGEQVLNDTEH